MFETISSLRHPDLQSGLVIVSTDEKLYKAFVVQHVREYVDSR